LDNSARENSREVSLLEEGGVYSEGRNRECSPYQESSQRDNSAHIFQRSCAEGKTTVPNVSGSVCSENEKGHAVCLSLLQKVNLEKVEEVVSMSLKIRLNTKGQICPLDSINRIIEETVRIQPLSLSLISPTSFQILYKKGDSVSFQKLLIPSMIELVEAKKDNFQQRDINRIAQLYLRGYFKELARAAIQDLPTPSVELVLARAAEIVKSKFQNKLLH
jgi:hypothetical protein